MSSVVSGRPVSAARARNSSSVGGFFSVIPSSRPQTCNRHAAFVFLSPSAPQRPSPPRSGGRGWGPLRSNGRVTWCFAQTRCFGLQHLSPPLPPHAGARVPSLSPRDDAGGEGL